MKRLSTGALLLVPVVAVGALLAELPAPDGAAGSPSPVGLFSPEDWPARSSDADEVVLSTPSVSRLEAAFHRLGYRWEDLFTAVPRLRLSALPMDLSDVRPAAERKRLFFQSVLPIVLLENERVEKERSWMEDILARHAAGKPVTAFETGWLAALADRYGVHADPFGAAARDELRKRVAGIPPSLALSMAALESGWGTSRFAAVGNNLFGHWTFRPGTGLVPHDRPAGAQYEVAVFPDLTHAYRAYLHNLNTHWAYSDFREQRAALPDPDAPDAAVTLARSLVKYSTRGTDYTADVVRVIRKNRLTRFDDATLDAPIRRQAARPDTARIS